MALPLIVEPAELHAQRADDSLLLVDLCSSEKYREGHIPGAVHCNTADLILGEKPAPGRLPPPEKLAAALAAIGFTSWISPAIASRRLTAEGSRASGGVTMAWSSAVWQPEGQAASVAVLAGSARMMALARSAF